MKAKPATLHQVVTDICMSATIPLRPRHFLSRKLIFILTYLISHQPSLLQTGLTRGVVCMNHCQCCIVSYWTCATEFYTLLNITLECCCQVSSKGYCLH